MAQVKFLIRFINTFKEEWMWLVTFYIEKALLSESIRSITTVVYVWVLQTHYYFPQRDWP